MPDPNTEHGLRVQLATAVRERDLARAEVQAWKDGVCQDCVDFRAEVRRLRAALATLDPLPVHVLDEARAGRQSVDWARVVKWMQEEARAALATGGDRG